jgi:hypothetical protein
MRTALLHPTPELPGETPTQQIRLPWNIRRTLADAGLNTVGDVRTADETLLLELKLNRGVVDFIRCNTRLNCRRVEIGLREKGK